MTIAPHRTRTGPLRVILDRREQNGRIVEVLSCAHVQDAPMYHRALEKRFVTRRCGQCPNAKNDRERVLAVRRARLKGAAP